MQPVGETIPSKNRAELLLQTTGCFGGETARAFELLQKFGPANASEVLDCFDGNAFMGAFLEKLRAMDKKPIG